MSTATLPGVWLDVPHDFHEVPLDLAVEDRVAAQARLLDELGLTDSGQREGLGLYFEALARNLRSGPVLGTAFCAVELAGRPSTATLTVAVHATTEVDPLVAAFGTAELMRRSEVHDHISVETVGSYLAAVATGSVQSESGLRQITVAVPFPGQPMTVLVCVASAAGDTFATYERLARQVAATVRLLNHQ